MKSAFRRQMRFRLVVYDSHATVQFLISQQPSFLMVYFCPGSFPCEACHSSSDVSGSLKVFIKVALQSVSSRWFNMKMNMLVRS